MWSVCHSCRSTFIGLIPYGPNIPHLYISPSISSFLPLKPTRVPPAALAPLRYVDRLHQNDHSECEAHSSPLSMSARRRCDRTTRLNLSEQELRHSSDYSIHTPAGSLTQDDPGNFGRWTWFCRYRNHFSGWRFGVLNFHDMDTCPRFCQPRYHYLGLHGVESQPRPPLRWRLRKNQDIEHQHPSTHQRSQHCPLERQQLLHAMSLRSYEEGDRSSMCSRDFA